MNSSVITTVVGNLGLTPELRYTPEGTPITDLRIGVDEYRKGAGEYNSITRWYEVTLAGRQAEVACEKLGKGDTVCVSGRQSVKEYNDRDGAPRFQLKIQASTFDIIRRKQVAAAATAPAN